MQSQARKVRSLSRVLLCDPMDCSPPGSSIHGIFQARVLEWGAISSSRGSSQPRDQTRASHTAGRLYHLSCLGSPLCSLRKLLRKPPKDLGRGLEPKPAIRVVSWFPRDEPALVSVCTDSWLKAAHQKCGLGRKAARGFGAWQLDPSLQCSVCERYSYGHHTDV